MWGRTVERQTIQTRQGTYQDSNGGNRHLSTQELSTLKPAVIATLCYE